MPLGRHLYALVLLAATPLGAQQPTPAQQAPAAPAVARIEVQPGTITLDVKDTLTLRAVAYDAAGRPVDVPLTFFSGARRSVGVTPQGLVTAHKPGTFRLFVAALPPGAGRSADVVRVEVPVTVRWPAVQTVEVTGSPGRFFAGTTVRHGARVVDVTGAERRNVPVTWASSSEAVLKVDRFGNVTAVKPGTATLTATAGGVAGTRRVTVAPNPARTITLTASATDVRTGDVVRFTAQVKDAAGRVVADMPVAFSVLANVEDTVIAPEAPALVDERGRFVAQRAGDYTVFATAGNLVAQRTVSVAHRHQSIRLNEGKGHGAVRDVHTSDIWVWTGKDGRDYAITGTWGGNGVAYLWDVTDPASPVKTDSVQVDARTVNDVKVDVERELCVITREGASNRRNGFVILDCSNPRDVKIVSRFDDGLLGGVHNVFVWNEHVFAINAGTRFDVISIEDPANPKRVSVFELDTPGHGIHDVWVHDGIAYASQWGDGVIVVDVGGAGQGGSLEHPKQIGQYKYPIGATHSAFPYYSKSAKRFYVFVGDEQFPYGLDPSEPDEAGGYIHIVDFTDWKNPEEVARYQIPEAGPHNFWIENDTLYVAYYNAGLRVVDVSGELKGNLYAQGRELVRFEARDPKGVVANAPMAWGPQPHRGHVFFSDFNSGLWSVKLPERTETLTP